MEYMHAIACDISTIILYTAEVFMGENLPNPASFVLQKLFAEFSFANVVKVAVSSMQSLIQEKKNFANYSGW